MILMLRIHLSPPWVPHIAPEAPTVGENATRGPPHVHVLDTESNGPDLIVSAYQKFNFITL